MAVVPCHKKEMFWGFVIGLFLPWLKHFIIEHHTGKNFFERLKPADTGLDVVADPILKSEDNESWRDFYTVEENEGVDPVDIVKGKNWIEGKRVRLLCWFMTDPGILTKTGTVKNTWSKHCDVRLFMSSKLDYDFPTVGLNVSSGRSHIAAKSRASWTYIFKHYLDQADYFMKADPDSFIVVDNQKMFLSYRDPEVPEAFGHALFYGHEAWLGNFSGFYTAGQSVVLSRESVKRLVSDGIDPTCFIDGQAEDLKTIVCLEKRGGYLIDTRDLQGRETFMPATGLSSVLAGHLPGWYTGPWRRHLGYCTTTECLSPFPIVFHYVTSEMYLLDYLTNGHHQLQHRKAFIEESYALGFLKFNGSIFAERNVN